MNLDPYVCRVCLLSDIKGYSLKFKDEFQNEYTFLEMFNICTRLEAHEQDDFPQYICQCCSNDLKTTFDFLVRAAATHQLLKEKEDVHYYELSDDEEESRVEESFNSQEISEHQNSEETDQQVDINTVVGNFETVQCEFMKTEYLDPIQGFNKQFEHFVEEEVAIENADESIEEYISSVGSGGNASDNDIEEDMYEEQSLLVSEQSIRHKPFRTSKTSPVKESSVQCKYCGKVLKQMSIKHHLKRCQKKEKLHLCSSCPKAFAVSCDLKNHMRTHDAERERTCVCEECGKGFFGKQALKVHMMRHLGVKEFECKLCHKKFITKKSLDVHEFTHNREMGRFVCKHCDKRFPSKADLTVHERFHTGDYPYKCEYCDKSYAVKSHYNYHLAKHKGVTYKCDKCDKEFMNRGSLTAHRYRHSERMPHECEICKKGFASPFKLNRHMSCHRSKEV